ncbi:transglutaminase-like domain-containing protein [Teredinibacter purpureus]|uniref:transglutaminase-like domain-containing protein n=1 Tax=Teredinibacter purpureus TaxID=2731756 RepID=UPI0005F829B7|nr:transglutaminase family protein [Teredinibacter purpureus]
MKNLSYKPYLAHTRYIDSEHPSIKAQATFLANGASNREVIAQRCFEFVRDQIEHSLDYKRNPVTCIASDVLKYRTGYCYAKSHLLAALLRANNIPAGLCYQRLTITDVPPFCLHGLNAVYLENVGWYRIDPRGNKKGVSAAFCPPNEKLAFPIVTAGEMDFAGILCEPLPIVIDALSSYATYDDVLQNLPDIELAYANEWTVSALNHRP